MKLRWERPEESRWLRFDTHVRERIVRTPEIVSIRFDKPPGFDYLPGQYIFVTVDSVDGKLTKHLTISSSPTEPDHLEVTKRLTGHPFANALSSLTPGDSVTLDGAYGSRDFTFTGEHPKLLLLTGGIGVTPFRSIIRYCADMCLKTDIVLLYSNRHEWDIAFRDEFDEIQRANGNLRVVYTVTKPTEEWRGLTGRVDAHMISNEINDCHERLAYVSGPRPMVDEMVAVLREGLGLDPGHVRYQYFPGFEDTTQALV